VAASPVSAASPQVAAIGDGIGISLASLTEVLGGGREVEFVAGAYPRRFSPTPNGGS
jgi:hypothetical protein